MTLIPPAKPEAPSILIADDSPAHLQLLSDMLKAHGCKPRTVSSGGMALRAAQASPPDLILLDVSMLDMSGYDVCRQIKADSSLAEIPILFISGLHSVADKIQGFQAGGVDYITKPFQFEEVEARISAHLEISRQRRELKEHYDKLKALEDLRDNLVHMIIHDLRGPVGVVMGFLDALQSKAANKLTDVEKRCLQGGIEGADKLAEMITLLLDISRMEAGQMPLNRTASDLANLARTVVRSMEPLLGNRRLDVEPDNRIPLARTVARSLGALLGNRRLDVEPDNRIPKAYCDEDITRRILINLIMNAIKHTPDDGLLRLKIGKEEGFVRVEVIDNGRGIPAEYHAKIFEKFGQVEARRQGHSTGLGLTFCKLAVETHGGRIGVNSVVGEGSTFWFTLPVAPPETPAAKPPPPIPDYANQPR